MVSSEIRSGSNRHWPQTNATIDSLFLIFFWKLGRQEKKDLLFHRLNNEKSWGGITGQLLFWQSWKWNFI